MRIAKLTLTCLFACGLLLSGCGGGEERGPTSKKNDVKLEELYKAKGETPPK
jgi:hypothetical protein